ncbi:class I SAM-dependent methyltransferase [Ruminococcaceae bacterium OttesenSCG-928-O06]|nr:class I SAM-dependent methyltransferase [Ruminococcaceae bacterium OttesenSCG-928-O06]
MQNKYDDPMFFEKYGKMARSQKGLAGAGEWPALQALLPPLAGKRVLDLGCGYGWHCIYAAQQGAAAVTGVDVSEKMLQVAREKTLFPNVEYLLLPIEDIAFAPASFDVVLSSLALHYVADFAAVCQKVHACLAPGGAFIFSVEHPIFTASGPQDWLYDDAGNAVCWPVDNYFHEGARTAVFLGETVQKYHRTLTTYLSGLVQAGFAITDVVEPTPPTRLLAEDATMAQELRRPMMLLVAAQRR